MAWSSLVNMSREALIATQTRQDSTPSLREDEEELVEEEEPEEEEDPEEELEEEKEE